MARLNVNGVVRDFDAEPDTPLLWVLREQLGLTGTKYGCGVAVCGSLCATAWPACAPNLSPMAATNSLGSSST